MAPDGNEPNGSSKGRVRPGVDAKMLLKEEEEYCQFCLFTEPFNKKSCFVRKNYLAHKWRVGIGFLHHYCAKSNLFRNHVH